jgi:hypothetical protein
MATVLALRDRALQSRDAIELLSSKWRVTIIHLLRDGALRTNELHGAEVAEAWGEPVALPNKNSPSA